MRTSATLHLSPVQSAGQLSLQATRLGLVFLWPRVFTGPLLLSARQGDLTGAGLLSGTRLSGSRRCRSDELPEAVDLVQDHLSHVAHVVDDLKVKVEGGRAVGLVRLVVPDLEVRVLEGFFDGDTRRRIKREHAVEEIEGVGVRVREQLLEGLLGHEGQVAHIFLGTRRADSGQCLLIRRTQDVQDLVELVDIVSALEEGTAAEQLGQNTTDRPYINCRTRTLVKQS